MWNASAGVQGRKAKRGEAVNEASGSHDGEGIRTGYEMRSRETERRAANSEGKYISNFAGNQKDEVIRTHDSRGPFDTLSLKLRRSARGVDDSRGAGRARRIEVHGYGEEEGYDLFSHILETWTWVFRGSKRSSERSSRWMDMVTTTRELKESRS